MPEIDYSYDGTLRSLEDSLQRLGLASVDLVLVHDPTGAGMASVGPSASAR